MLVSLVLLKWASNAARAPLCLRPPFGPRDAEPCQIRLLRFNAAFPRLDLHNWSHVCIRRPVGLRGRAGVVGQHGGVALKEKPRLQITAPVSGSVRKALLLITPTGQSSAAQKLTQNIGVWGFCGSACAAQTPKPAL